MQVRVEEELCSGCEVCVDASPEVFEMDGGAAKVKVNPIPPELEESCQEAADVCPSEAIILE